MHCRESLKARLDQSRLSLSQLSLKSYVAMLSSQNVVPNSPITAARGAVQATLLDNRLAVWGQFSSLSSPVQDDANQTPQFATPAFHIHQGDPAENGPLHYALPIISEQGGRHGRVMGEYLLTRSQLQALASGRLYVDIHTTINQQGELRGTFQPYQEYF